MRKDVTLNAIIKGGDKINKSALARQYGCCWETIDRRLNPDKYKRERKKRIYTSILDKYKVLIDEKIENNNIPATGIYFLLKEKYNYEGKYGTQENDDKDVLANLFLDSVTPDLADTDEALEVPRLDLNLNEIDKRTKDRARIIVERLSAYYFDAKYIEEHPYIPNKIAQEVDNIRRLLKMLAVNEKAQDTLITSIVISSTKGTLYGSLTSLQNSMLSMQSQLNQLTANLENIFKEMQENCEQTFAEKEKETSNEDGSISIRGSREFIKQIDAMLNGESKKDDEYNEETEIQKVLG